jgi:hypothetical protein
MSPPPRVLVFGEDENDREILKELIVAICPALGGKVEKRRKPLIMAKGANKTQLSHRARKLAAVVRAEEARGPIAGVFVHEDADDVAPADEKREQQMVEACAKHCLKIYAVVPAWEIEAWFFLFPEAVSSAFPSWKPLPRLVGARVDLRRDAKERFRDSTTGRRAGRRYRESDGPLVARKIAELGIARSPLGVSAAYVRFVSSCDDCCHSRGVVDGNHRRDP